MAGKISYMRQLDGLRALSVAAVANDHWRGYFYPVASAPLSEIGVNTFFVISGFLITGILLDNRSETNRFFALKQFYVRRFLRIFPLYYVTLTLALILNAQTVRDTWLWHVAYLSNVLFYTHGWLGQVSHFWSLAVEEQFYLFWPLLMLFMPKRLILPTIIASIAIAPMFEMSMNTFYTKHSPYLTASVLTPSCMDALGIGALLAYAAKQKISMKYFVYFMLLFGLMTCVAWRWYFIPEIGRPFYRLGINCILGTIVFCAARGFKGPIGWLLESPPLNYLGKISYGLYIIHNLAVSIWVGFIRLFGNPHYSIPTQFLILIVITVGLASLSWYILEKPINNLKRRFPYPTEKKPSSSHQVLRKNQ